MPGVCCFEIFDPSQNASIPCNNVHVTLVEPTGKTYCYHHKYIAQKQFIAKKRLELREKLKLEKMNAKMQAKKEKDLEKEAIKKEKMEQKIKTTKKKPALTSILNENVIVSSMDSFNKCSQVLKTGQNKGEKCGIVTLVYYFPNVLS